MKKMRKAKIIRKTRETEISISLNLDGTGKAKINTPFPFLNHMLELVARHGLMDLTVYAKGDIEVDAHHTIEDMGIVFGQAIARSLGKKAGIVRYGHAILPMDEALTMVSLDISGRPYLDYASARKLRGKKIKDFDTSLVEHFFRGVSNHAGITLHIEDYQRGKDAHHILEAEFKAFARALRDAVRIDPRERGVPSTKGKIA